MSPRPLLLSLLVAAGAFFFGPAPPVASARDRAAAPETARPSGRIIVKFREASGLTAGAQGLKAHSAAAVRRADDLLHAAAPGAVYQRLFTRSAEDLADERRRAEAAAGRTLPDLNTYIALEPGLGRDRAALARVAAVLRADPDVEAAYLEPVYAVAGSAAALPGGRAGSAASTADFTGLQGYLGAAPDGLGVLPVAGVAGGRGEGVKLVDVEAAWLWSHEDLPSPFFTAGDPINDLAERNHGTAAMGVVRGDDDGIGVRGLAPDCEVGGASYGGLGVSGAISAATSATSSGDVILIELHAPGPNANGAGEYGYIPIEYWQGNFDAIAIATALGRIVVEAAGNGLQDLDDPVYNGLFDPDVRDSEALLVGAGEPGTREPAWFTNYGRRVDVQGWSDQIATCGYGDLQGPDGGYPETEWYTQTYNGTSGASAMVAGATVVLQGLVRNQLGYSVDPAHLRDVLVATGSAQAADLDHVGPRPDVAAAWQEVQTNLCNVSGRVLDATTQLPIPDVPIAAQGGAVSLLTDPLGRFSLCSDPGPVTFTIDDYDYALQTLSVSMSPGPAQIRDITLVPLPKIALSGHVAGADSQRLGDVRVEALNTDLRSAESHSDGVYSLPGVSVGRPIQVLFHRKPGYGARVLDVLPEQLPGNLYPLNAELPVADDSLNTIAGFYPSTIDWQWDYLPSGPDSCFSMPGCWGVGMHSYYGDNRHSTITSSPIDMPGQQDVRLSLHYWCHTEPGYDGARMELLQSGHWMPLTPEGGYSFASVAALNGDPGWSGYEADWHGAVFDLSGFNLADARFRILFASDAHISGMGFFFDDVSYDVGNEFVAVDPFVAAATGAARVSAAPNPFNPLTVLTWEAPRAGVVSVRVYDARGRLVRTLRDGATASLRGVLTWDGRDDDGRACASGVYLVRMRAPQGAVATDRVTLLR